MKTQSLYGEWCIVRGYFVRDNQNIMMNWADPSQRIGSVLLSSKQHIGFLFSIQPIILERNNHESNIAIAMDFKECLLATFGRLQQS